MSIIILDTETSGLLPTDALEPFPEIYEICLINTSGRILLSTLIKPTTSIPLHISRVNGIGNSDVANSPTWESVSPIVWNLLKDTDVWIYNSSFDSKLLEYWFKGNTPWRSVSCVMEAYGKYLNAAYRPKLPNLSGFDAHTAYADCISTLRLMEKMGIVDAKRNYYDFGDF